MARGSSPDGRRAPLQYDLTEFAVISLTFRGGRISLWPIDVGPVRAGANVPALSQILKGDSL